MPFRSAERRKASPVGWEKLCPDVRPLVLRNLSVREMACAAPTCREFWEAYQNRSMEEPGRLRLVAEETFGKKRLAGFVTACHGLMSTMSHEGLLPRAENMLVINDSGHSNILTMKEAREAPVGDGRIIHIQNWGRAFPLSAVLWGKLPGSGKVARILIQLHNWGSGLKITASISEEADPAAVGLMLSICSGNPADLATPWQSPLQGTVLLFEGSRSVVERREVEDLVRPLTALAASYELDDDSPVCYTHCSSAGSLTQGVQPLGHLQILHDMFPQYHTMVPGYV
jgi:hypothetical protein